jgi:hypothetical protein
MGANVAVEGFAITISVKILLNKNIPTKIALKTGFVVLLGLLLKVII